MVKNTKKLKEAPRFNPLNVFLLVSFFIVAGIAFYQLTFAATCPTLKSGSRGACVRQLQQDLNALGANPQLTEDGRFGPTTRYAVEQYQSQKSLKVDGIVGRQTKKAITSDIQVSWQCFIYAQQGRPCSTI